MTVRVSPSSLGGTVRAPASKSETHRLLICAALADAPTEIAVSETSEDVAATVRCLEALGATIEKTDDGLRVNPIIKAAENSILDCGESGSTARFLLPVAAALGCAARFTCAPSLAARPFAPLTRAMREHGALSSGDALPLTLSGALQRGKYVLPGNVSSQFVSGLLLALPLLSGDSEIALTTPLESAAYADMTRDMTALFSVTARSAPTGFLIPGGQKYVSPRNISVGGDWSGAAALLCAGALCGNVTVSGLSSSVSYADNSIFPILRSMGAQVTDTGGTVSVTAAPLRGAEIDVSGAPDLLPVLSALATSAAGRTVFKNAARERLKESDRLHACAQLINSLGGAAEETADSLTVFGGEIRGGEAECCGDHRVVMAAALLALRSREGVTIPGAQAVNKSYCAFWDDLRTLGAKIERL